MKIDSNFKQKIHTELKQVGSSPDGFEEIKQEDVDQA